MKCKDQNSTITTENYEHTKFKITFQMIKLQIKSTLNHILANKFMFLVINQATNCTLNVSNKIMQKKEIKEN